MRVIVHHLPTGCKWEVEHGIENIEKFADEVFKNEVGFVLGSKTECIYFPANVVDNSVIKVIE